MGNRGGSVRSINASKSWLAGTYVEGDAGDYIFAGSVMPTAFRVDDTATYWCERTKANMPPGGYGYHAAAAGAAINKRKCWPIANPDNSPGTIGSY